MSITRHQAAGAYRRWDPPSFNEEEGAISGQHPQDAGLDPATGLPAGLQFPTAEELERMQEAARSEAHEEGYAAGFEQGRTAGHAEGRQQGHAEGYAAGLAEGRQAGYEEGRAQARDQATRLEALANQLEDAFTQLDGQVTEELMGLALALTRKMIRGTLAARPEAIVDTIRAALQELPQNNARIRLHPDDAALVREHLGDSLGHGEHRLLEDDTLTRGGCLVEAGGTQVDATVETRWRRIIESLGRNETDWDDPT